MAGLNPVGPSEVPGVGGSVDDQVGASGRAERPSARGQVPRVGAPPGGARQGSHLMAASLKDRNELDGPVFPEPPVDQDDAHGGSVAPIRVGIQVHLIDGTYELFRHFFGVPSHVNQQGREVAAVRGVLSSVLGLLADGATHVGVATDHVIESFRNDMWPGYKTSAGRRPGLLGQFDLLEEALFAMGVVVWPMVTLEADDALASAAAVAAADPVVEQVVICTPDKDLGQCVVGTRVVQMDRRKGAVIDEAGVRAKFGVGPASIPDYLALVGDSADGFPGLSGWGAKTTAAVLARYEHLEAIPDAPGQWDVPIRGRRRPGRHAGRPAGPGPALPRPGHLADRAAGDREVEELRWVGPRDEFAELCEDVLDSPSLAPRAIRWRWGDRRPSCGRETRRARPAPVRSGPRWTASAPLHIMMHSTSGDIWIR